MIWALHGATTSFVVRLVSDNMLALDSRLHYLAGAWGREFGREMVELLVRRRRHNLTEQHPPKTSRVPFTITGHTQCRIGQRFEAPGMSCHLQQNPRRETPLTVVAVVYHDLSMPRSHKQTSGADRGPRW